MTSVVRKMARLASGALVIGGILATMAPATAAPAPSSDSKTQVTVISAPKSAAGDVGTQSWQGSCFGYSGTFRDGSDVLLVNWFGSGRLECFGIAPDRTIWHTWPGHGVWSLMPHNGRADDVFNASSFAGGRRIFRVWVAPGPPGQVSGVYCTEDRGDGRWRPWYRTGC